MTTRKLIGLGDKTTTGGTVLTAYLDMQILNQGTATEGCLASCGKCGQSGIIKVVEDVQLIINDRRAAREGDIVLCACEEGANRLIGSPGSMMICGTENPSPFGLVLGAGQETQAGYAAVNEGLNSGTLDFSSLFAQTTAAQTTQQTSTREPLALPARIFETQKKMDDYQAPDMLHGDLSVEELRDGYGLRDVSVYVSAYQVEERDRHARVMFDEFRTLSDMFSFYGPHQDLMRKMIDHMQANTGQPFTDPQLDRAIGEHPSMSGEESTLQKIKIALREHIDWEGGFYPRDRAQKFVDEIMDSRLPKFNHWTDRVNGLGISVHDTWATHITLQALEVVGDRYRATVHFRIQDHFGLDNTDIYSTFFRQFRIFRIWFVLQRGKWFDYRPFITEMSVTKIIEGSRYD